VDSIALVGMEGHPIEVEVSVAQGLPAFTVVGLPDASIQEARERVRAAIQSSGEEWPQKRITVNLSPAHLRKAGSTFDAAMALGVLVASGRIPQDRLRDVCVLGELSLDGAMRRVRGVLPSVVAAARAGARAAVVPPANAREAALVSGIDVFAIDHLARAVRFFRGEAGVDPWRGHARAETVADYDVDLSDVRGNAVAKRALEIAAAGGHNVLMMGAPGGGKTMLARRIGTIVPPLSEEEAFEVTRVYSVAGLVPEDRPLVARRPFRAPHHSVSSTGLVGGGSGMPHPGEASLAHRGTLFLDEFAEFRREALQALRQPMEDGIVTIVRSKWSVTFPARFQLIAASNPCPCGSLGDPLKPCTCRPGRIASYAERLSGPIMDRIDVQVTVERLNKRQLFGAPEGDPSAVVARRVADARAFASARLAAQGRTCNAELPPRDLEQSCKLAPAGRRILENAIERHGLSARAAHRALRVARTIADLAAEGSTGEMAVKEAVGLRVDDVRG
jgi:magnesium chelatase family protein